MEAKRAKNRKGNSKVNSLMEHYTVIRKIGEGSFGECFLCCDKRTGLHVVIKEISMEDMQDTEVRNTERESAILLTMDHPNIVRGIESFKEDGFLYIAMTYCEHGELTSLIKRHHKSQMHFEESQVLRWIAQLASALWYIHSKGLIHRDLKSQNIFLDQDLNVHIGDFGIARTINPGSMASTFIGSPLYMSPELIQGTSYNSQSDMWSLGCMIFEILCLKTAFQAKNINTLIMKIVSGKVPELPGIYSSKLRDICLNLLNQVPDQRMTAAQLCGHDLIAPFIFELNLPHPESFDPPTAAVGNAFASRLSKSISDQAISEADIFSNTSKINIYIKQGVEAENNAIQSIRQGGASPTYSTGRRMTGDIPESASSAFKYNSDPILSHIFSQLVLLVDHDSTVASQLVSIVRLTYSFQDVDMLRDITLLDIPPHFNDIYKSKTAWTDNSCTTWDRETELLSWIFERIAGEKGDACLGLCRLLVSADDYS